MDHEHGAAQLERLTFFSDAVFAIAMTLLVIDVRLPPLGHVSERELANALAELSPKFFAFILSFFVIGRFWLAHHRIFGLLARTSERLLWINLLMLLAIAFMPFPTALISEHGSLSVAVMFYAASLLLLGVIQRALVVTALGKHGLVRGDVPDAERRYLLRGSLIPSVIGIIGIAAAAFSSWAGLAVLVFGSPIIFRVFHRNPPTIS
jgi:uncharacterized membrane protein